MRYPNINTRLVELARRAVDFSIEFELKNERGRVTGTIDWDKENGFEVVAEVVAWGRYYPATLYQPAEQATLPVASLHFNTWKIQEVADRLLEYGFTL